MVLARSASACNQRSASRPSNAIGPWLPNRSSFSRQAVSHPKVRITWPSAFSNRLNTPASATRWPGGLQAVGWPCTSASQPVAGTMQRQERAVLDHRDSTGACLIDFTGTPVSRTAVARRPRCITR